jgi:hypothetical protein
MTSSDPPELGDTPVGEPEAAGTSKEQSEAIVRQRALGRRLRAMFNEVTDEPLPDAFLNLLDELERKEKGR